MLMVYACKCCSWPASCSHRRSDQVAQAYVMMACGQLHLPTCREDGAYMGALPSALFVSAIADDTSRMLGALASLLTSGLKRTRSSVHAADGARCPLHLECAVPNRAGRPAVSFALIGSSLPSCLKHSINAAGWPCSRMLLSARGSAHMLTCLHCSICLHHLYHHSNIQMLLICCCDCFPCCCCCQLAMPALLLKPCWTCSWRQPCQMLHPMVAAAQLAVPT